MRRSLAVLFSVICAVWTAGVAAQPVEKSLDSFGKLGLGLGQSTGHRDLNSFRPNANYEPMRRYSGSARLFRLTKYVGYLDVKGSGQVSGQCTATLISAERLLTNAHCVPAQGRARPTSIRFTLGYLRVNDRRGEQVHFVHPDPILRDEDLDYAVLKLVTPVPDFVDPNWKVRVPLAGEPLLVVGHPLLQPLHLTQAGCTMLAAQGRDSVNMMHVCDTEKGHSGSLIFSADDPSEIVGLHKEFTSEANRAVRLTALDWPRLLTGSQTGTTPNARAALQNAQDDLAQIRKPSAKTQAEWDTVLQRHFQSSPAIKVIERPDRVAFEISTGPLKREATGCTHSISGKHIEELDRLLRAYLPNAARRDIVVEGHTDSEGPAKINKACSRVFAQAYVNALEGTSAFDLMEQIQVIGYGEDRPIADNASEQGRSKNRRIVFSVLR